jgi:CRP-like cAMP-binding protein
MGSRLRRGSNNKMTRKGQLAMVATRRTRTSLSAGTARREAPAKLAGDLRRAFGVPGIGLATALTLAAAMERRDLPAGALAISRSEQATALWLVSRGKVAAGLIGPRGVLTHSRSLRRGAWIDVASAMLHGSYMEDAVTETDSVLLVLPVEAVFACAALHPELMPAVVALTASRVRELTTAAHHLVTRTALMRCASWLLDHAEHTLTDDGRRREQVTLRQPKRSVAMRLGTTAETLSRMLRQLSSDGMIEVRGSIIELLDVPRLRRAADVAPT